ncbi:hypothetical protein ACHAXS_010322 [Conticribra weissflogii]
MKLKNLLNRVKRKKNKNNPPVGHSKPEDPTNIQHDLRLLNNNEENEDIEASTARTTSKSLRELDRQLPTIGELPQHGGKQSKTSSKRVPLSDLVKVDVKLEKVTEESIETSSTAYSSSCRDGDAYKYSSGDSESDDDDDDDGSVTTTTTEYSDDSSGRPARNRGLNKINSKYSAEETASRSTLSSRNGHCISHQENSLEDRSSSNAHSNEDLVDHKSIGSYTSNGGISGMDLVMHSEYDGDCGKKITEKEVILRHHGGNALGQDKTVPKPMNVANQVFSMVLEQVAETGCGCSEKEMSKKNTCNGRFDDYTISTYEGSDGDRGDVTSTVSSLDSGMRMFM